MPNTFQKTIYCVIIKLYIINIVSRDKESEARFKRQYTKPHVQNGYYGQCNHQQHIFQLEPCYEHSNVNADSAAKQCGEQQFAVAQMQFAFVKQIFVSLAQ